jgi:hypothetical protein
MNMRRVVAHGDLDGGPCRFHGRPEPTDGEQKWAVNDLAGAIISDETGRPLRSFTTMRDVPPPQENE